MKELKIPYKDLVPPLTTEEFEALKASIEADGVREAICIDDEGNILDGHNRYRILPDAPTRMISGLTDAEKEAFVFQCNGVRRNLSPDQKKEQHRKMKLVAEKLRNEDPKKNTQSRIAQILGVAQQTVSDWSGTNTASGISSKLDARVKVSSECWPVICQRIESGENREQVAADFGITGRRAAAIATKHTNIEGAKAERTIAAQQVEGTCSIHVGDFRTAGEIVEDDSIDLILTDPPYDKESASLYSDLGEFASRVLKPGSWCLAYTGTLFWLQSGNALAGHLEQGPLLSIFHSGSFSRLRKFRTLNSWKPVLAFFKPPIGIWWDWFRDSASGGREKSDHEWQQALSEADHFVKALSPERGVILDPFVGSGTVCLSAKNLGRKWIGFEIDEQTACNARARLDATVDA